MAIRRIFVMAALPCARALRKLSPERGVMYAGVFNAGALPVADPLCAPRVLAGRYGRREEAIRGMPVSDCILLCWPISHVAV